MRDKLEVLKAQLPDALAAWSESKGGKVTLGWIHAANPVAVSELLAALEEKDQRIKGLEVTQMTGPLSVVLRRAAELERIIEGVDQLAIDGGWTARGMSEHAKSLETRNAELECANAVQDDHINQQQDRIETLENKNGELGKYTGELERRLQQPIKLPDCVLVLLNHIEDVVDEYNWGRIDVEKWNAVTMFGREKVEGE